MDGFIERGAGVIEDEVRPRDLHPPQPPLPPRCRKNRQKRRAIPQCPRSTGLRVEEVETIRADAKLLPSALDAAFLAASFVARRYKHLVRRA